MANSIVRHSVSGFLVGQRTKNGYINATHLCKASGKKFNDYTRLDTTQNFLEALSRSTGIPADVLIIAQTTGKNENRGSYVHPKVAINLGQWLSPEFAVLVSDLVFNWITHQGNPEWQESRTALSDNHTVLTDATKAYIERHKDEMSARRIGWMHTVIAQKLAIAMLGSSATKLRKAAGVKSFRDLLSTDQLRLLQQLERLAALLIEKQDLYPTDAILEAANRLMVGI